jgi:hypothetical protein
VRFSRGLIVSALLAAGIVFPAGCGSGQRDDASARGVQVRERDFRIRAPRALHEGKVAFDVDNAGPVDHELIVVRASGALPRRSDGLTIDEDSLESRTVGVLEPGLGERQLTVDLRPGRYEMFCNMQGHYLAGMHRSFRVG